MLYIILFLEVFYYATFFRLSKREGNFLIYLLIFAISTTSLYLLDSYRLVGYLVFLILGHLGLSFLAKSKDKAFNIFLILISMLIKIVLEPICFIFYIFINNIYVCTILASLIKLLLLVIFDGSLNKLYLKALKDWNSNRFYIRYLASVGLMLYIIATCVLLVVQLI